MAPPPDPDPDRELEEENLALRRQLESLLREARSNEDKMRRFDQLEHRLIGARSIVELLRLLLIEYKLAFGLEYVSLTLVDRDHEASRMLEADLRDDATLKGLTLAQSPAELQALYDTSFRPWLGAFKAEAHAELFSDAPLGSIGSVALLPLIRHGLLIGSLHFGSRSRERYQADAGTHFLERLCSIGSVCLESALNQERLKLAGLTDMLTGVHNRRYFEHRCQIEIAQARRYRHPLACMFLDIDGFKRINDSHGHQSGDEVLRGVGHLIQGQLRAGDTIARYGGEEFVVLLPQTSVRHAGEIAERIRASIADKAILTGSGRSIAVTISIGLAMLGKEVAGIEAVRLAEALVGSADKALYQAKNGGRNRVVLDADSVTA
jgi:two-component system cell cycle response regulator